MKQLSENYQKVLEESTQISTIIVDDELVIDPSEIDMDDITDDKFHDNLQDHLLEDFS